MEEMQIQIETCNVTLCCFHCTRGKVLLKDLEAMNSYYKKHHKRFGQRCDVCLNKFLSAAVVEDHLNRDHWNGEAVLYICETCEPAKSFGSVMHLICHNKNQHPKHGSVCLHCQNVFETKVELDQHRARHLEAPQRKLPKGNGKGKKGKC